MLWLVWVLWVDNVWVFTVVSWVVAVAVRVLWVASARSVALALLLLSLGVDACFGR